MTENRAHDLVTKETDVAPSGGGHPAPEGGPQGEILLEGGRFCPVDTRHQTK